MFRSHYPIRFGKLVIDHHWFELNQIYMNARAGGWGVNTTSLEIWPPLHSYRHTHVSCPAPHNECSVTFTTLLGLYWSIEKYLGIHYLGLFHWMSQAILWSTVREQYAPEKSAHLLASLRPRCVFLRPWSFWSFLAPYKGHCIIAMPIANTYSHLIWYTYHVNKWTH